jgi:hypothetical protein
VSVLISRLVVQRSPLAGPREDQAGFQGLPLKVFQISLHGLIVKRPCPVVFGRNGFVAQQLLEIGKCLDFRELGLLIVRLKLQQLQSDFNWLRSAVFRKLFKSLSASSSVDSASCAFTNNEAVLNGPVSARHRSGLA